MKINHASFWLPTHLIRQSRQSFKLSSRLYQTLSFWLDEPRLHDASLYIPLLPPQYQPQLLASIFQNQIVSGINSHSLLSIHLTMFSYSIMNKL